MGNRRVLVDRDPTTFEFVVEGRGETQPVADNENTSTESEA